MNYPTRASERTRWNIWVYEDGKFSEMEVDCLVGDRDEMVAQICEHPHQMQMVPGFDLTRLEWPIISKADRDRVDLADLICADEKEYDRLWSTFTEEMKQYSAFRQVWRCQYLVFHDLGDDIQETNVVFIRKYGDLLTYAKLTGMPITTEHIG